MKKKEATEKISDIIVNALIQKEKITKKQDKKITKEIIEVLDQIE